VDVGPVVSYNVPPWSLRVTSPSLISPSFFAVFCSEPSITLFSSLFPYLESGVLPSVFCCSGFLSFCKAWSTSWFKTEVGESSWSSLVRTAWEGSQLIVFVFVLKELPPLASQI